MGFFGDAWGVVKDVGAILLSTLLTLWHYAYILVVMGLNAFKPKIPISDCLIKVLEELDLLSSNVDLRRVSIIENAIGLAGLGLTNNYTIYISSSFDEIDDLWLFLHELKHVEQYQDLGYVVFVATYDYQLVRYGYKNAPLEISASDFATANKKSVKDKYDADCIPGGGPAGDPDSPIFRQIINEDWTMLLDLI